MTYERDTIGLYIILVVVVVLAGLLAYEVIQYDKLANNYDRAMSQLAPLWCQEQSYKKTTTLYLGEYYCNNSFITKIETTNEEEYKNFWNKIHEARKTGKCDITGSWGSFKTLKEGQHFITGVWLKNENKVMCFGDEKNISFYEAFDKCLIELSNTNQNFNFHRCVNEKRYSHYVFYTQKMVIQ